MIGAITTAQTDIVRHHRWWQMISAMETVHRHHPISHFSNLQTKLSRWTTHSTQSTLDLPHMTCNAISCLSFGFPYSHTFSVHSSSSSQRRRHDSEYANIASIIRPQSKCSGRMSVTDGREKRRVVQFHFTSWNDYRAPECTIALLRLLCKMRKMDEFNHSPVVVHCRSVIRYNTLPFIS